MSSFKITALAAALMFAPLGAAVAQDAPAAPVSPAPAMSPADEAFKAQGEAFEQANMKFMTELQAVLGDAALDKATKTARSDAAITQFTPQIEAFAVVLKAYLVELAARPENANQQTAILAASETAPAQLLAIPTTLREAIQRDLNAAPQ